jgi:hypothetical protein
LLLQITGNQMFGAGYPLVAQYSDYGSYSQLVEELKCRDTHTYAQLGDLSFWKERRVKSLHLCNQLTGNSAFASPHFNQLVLLYKFSSNISIDPTAKDSFPEAASRQSYRKQ